MGWTFYYQLTRDRRLDAGERKALRAHVKTVKLSSQSEGYDFWVAGEANPGAQVAFGATKIAPSDPWQTRDVAALMAAFTALRSVVAGTTVGVSDDLHTVGWVATAGAYQLGVGVVQDEVTWPRTEAPAWVPLTPPRKPRAKPAEPAPGGETVAVPRAVAIPSTDAAMLALLKKVDRKSATAADLARLAQVDPDLATRAALINAHTLTSRVLDACGELMARAINVSDDARTSGLAAWREARDPRKLERALEHLARVDAGVASALAAELAAWKAGSLTERQWSAARMIAHHAVARPHVIAALRRSRGTAPNLVTNFLIDRLTQPGAAEVAATVFLHLEVRRCTDDVVRAAVRVDDPRRFDYVRRLLASDQYTRPIATALGEVKAPEVAALLDALTVHRDPGARLAATYGLVEHRGRAAVPRLIAAVEYARRHGVWSWRRSIGSWGSDQVGGAHNVVARMQRRTHGLLERALGDDLAAWPAELAAQGLDIPDPGVPCDRLARVLDANPDVRRDAIELWHEEALAARDATQLLALTCAERLHSERCSRDGVYRNIESFTTRVRLSSYWEAWREHTALPFDPQYKYDHVTWDWFVAHAGKLAPQVVPAPLAAATTADGAKQLAASFPVVCFRLGAAEQAALQAEEAMSVSATS